VLAAVEAARTVGLSRRDDFYWALHAVLVDRRDQQEFFDQAFQVFRRDRRSLETMTDLPLPDVQLAAGHLPADAVALNRRLAELLTELLSRPVACRQDGAVRWLSALKDGA
jgi:hypothetical protein